MEEEIKQNGKTVLWSTDGFSMPMFFNNLCGKNFSGSKPVNCWYMYELGDGSVTAGSDRTCIIMWSMKISPSDLAGNQTGLKGRK